MTSILELPCNLDVVAEVWKDILRLSVSSLVATPRDVLLSLRWLIVGQDVMVHI